MVNIHMNREKDAFKTLSQMLDSTVTLVCRELIQERLTFERELTWRRVRTLFTDEKRNQIVNETVDQITREYIVSEVRLTEAICEEKDILVNETLYEVLRDMITHEYEMYKIELAEKRIETALSGSWISSQYENFKL